MKLIFDSCSFILLSKALVIDEVVATYGSYTTIQVYEEVMKGKQHMYEDALKLELLKKKEKISIIRANGRVTQRIAHDFNMGMGEASVIALGIEEKSTTIVTDNKQGRKAARINKLPLVGSIEIVVDLFQKGKINREKTQNALQILQKEGWFDRYLIDHAMEDIK